MLPYMDTSIRQFTWPKKEHALSKYATLPETRKAHLFAGVRKSRDRLRAMTPAQAACWKIRNSLDAEPDPYTPAERERAEAIRSAVDALEKDAAALNAEVLARLLSVGEDSPDARAMAIAIQTAADLRINLKF